jgi:hypothetical protein
MDNIKDFIAGLNLLQQVEKDVPALAGTFNGRYSAEVACPKCGGATRLRFRLGQDGMQRVYCSHCAPKGLDAIAYIQWRDGSDFKEARRFWAESGTSLPAEWTATAPAPKPEQAPGAIWQSKARAFIDSCAAYLWSDAPDARQALAYLRAGRLLTDDTIRRARLGYNPKSRKAAAADWGVSDRESVFAVQGITIPREIVGEIWAVNVRRFTDGKPYAGKDKYICVSGSVLGLAGADGLKRDCIALVFGGEMDRILAEQHAPAGVACVTFGGEGRKVSDLWANMLAVAKAVHVCMDNDDPGDNGAGRWADIPKTRRARVPQGKDLTEFAQQGGNVAAWISETTGVYGWQPPADTETREMTAAEWLAVFDDETQPEDMRARAWARMEVCRGFTLASDGQRWLVLAQ